MEDWGDGPEVTPSGYQGAARHTWTAGCDGFHEAQSCPPAEPPQEITLKEITLTGGLTLPPLGVLFGQGSE